MKRRVLLPVFLASGLLFAHPMGNFSVNHYSRIEVTAQGAADPVRAGPGRDPEFPVAAEVEAGADQPARRNRAARRRTGARMGAAV